MGELRTEHKEPLNDRVIIKEYTLVLSKHLELPFVKNKHLNVGAVIPFSLQWSLFLQPELRSQ